MATVVDFRSTQDVEDWVRNQGLDVLRELVHREQMRASSQFWASDWLARLDAQRQREARQIRGELADCLARHMPV